MGLYRAMLTLAAPLLLGFALLRLLRRRETTADLCQRLGRDAPATPGAIWLHGASNGELTSARPLIDALIDAFPNNPLVITANTTTGRALAAGWNLPNTTTRLAPFDFRWALARFRARVRPVALIVLENELWPNRLDTATEPVIVTGARMSPKSARLWSGLPGLANRLMARIERLCPQDPASADRFITLGLPSVRLGPTGTLKSAVSLPAPDSAGLAALGKIFHRSDTLLAASTHAGEDQIILDGFHAARATRPDLKLILAPRHPNRAAEIAQMIAATGLPWAQRSTGGNPDAKTAIYLADTLGEMPLWYALAGVTFVGGSLVPRGGHTPFEPAKTGSAILHGPHTENFTESYAALAEANGAIRVETAEGIASALQELAGTHAQTETAKRTTKALAQFNTGQAVIDDAIETLRARLTSHPDRQPPG